MTTVTRPALTKPGLTRPGSTRTGPARHRSAAGRLIRAELKLTVRDPLVLTFVFVFPVVTMLIIGGSFGTTPDPDFEGIDPSHWYVASYLTVVIAATGLVMMPVHLASYRERGVLRRFSAAGFPRWSFAVAELVVGLVTILVAGLLLLAVAAPVYGVPSVQEGWQVGAGFILGSVAFVSIGIVLGSVLPSARGAQAIGLLLFFPSFLLGAGGPPPQAMGAAMANISDVLPLTWVTKSIREPWLGIGTPVLVLVLVAVVALAASTVAVRRSAL